MSVTDASVRPHNIYITSDEEIKEGDWCIDDGGIVKCTAHSGAMNHYYTKIILTTDQELIKDGVQPIPDEFLEWFVKNPSCEFIRVGLEIWNDGNHNPIIIIPKEEPKQETLEEVAKGYSERHQDVSGNLGKYLVSAVFQDGAEWQQEQDKNRYSEEDILDAWELGAKEGLPLTRKKKEELFEQLKKK
jgi:hypothetical protein